MASTRQMTMEHGFKDATLAGRLPNIPKSPEIVSEAQQHGSPQPLTRSR
jgi:hypothetical protein